MTMGSDTVPVPGKFTVGWGREMMSKYSELNASPKVWGVGSWVRGGRGPGTASWRRKRNTQPRTSRRWPGEEVDTALSESWRVCERSKER